MRTAIPGTVEAHLLLDVRDVQILDRDRRVVMEDVILIDDGVHDSGLCVDTVVVVVALLVFGTAGIGFRMVLDGFRHFPKLSG